MSRRLAYSLVSALFRLAETRPLLVGVYNGGTDTGIFTGSGGALTTIVKLGDAAPVGTFTDFGPLSVSGDTTAFVGAYTGGSGLFMGSSGTLTSILLQGDSLFGSTVTSLTSRPFRLRR